MDYLEVGSHDSTEVAELHKWAITDVLVRTRTKFRSGPVPVEFGPVPFDLAGTRQAPRFFQSVFLRS